MTSGIKDEVEKSHKALDAIVSFARPLSSLLCLKQMLLTLLHGSCMAALNSYASSVQLQPSK